MGRDLSDWLYSSYRCVLGSFTCFLTLGDSTFPPTCATSCCGRSLLCVSQSEMLNASLISSFYLTGFNNFQFYSTGFDNFQFYSTGFNNFQFYSTGFNNFQFYSTGFNTTLSFDLGLPFFVLFFGTLLQEVYLLYMQYFFCLFLILVRPFVQFCSLLTKLYDILRGNSHWPYSLTKYFTFTIV